MKITICIEDVGAGVKCTSTPTFEEMAKGINAGLRQSAAEGYALLALNTIRNESKKAGQIITKIPRVLRP